MSRTNQNIKGDGIAYYTSEWSCFIEKLETFIEAIIDAKYMGSIENAVRRNELRNDLISYLVEKGVHAP